METISSRTLDSLTESLERNGVEYLYIGKGGAIIHGFADTTQDADIFVNHTAENKARLITALKEVGFILTPDQEGEIKGGRDFVQLHNGPFDLDLVYAPDGIEKFEDAWKRGRTIDGHKVCSIDDIIASKRAANRPKDRESLHRLERFKEYLKDRPERGERLEPLNPTWRDKLKKEMASRKNAPLTLEGGAPGAERPATPTTADTTTQPDRLHGGYKR